MNELPAITSFEDFEAAAAEIIRPPFKSAFGGVWFHEIGGQKPRRDWLVKGLVLNKSFGIMYGPPGCGKSFLTSDLCLTAAAVAANVSPGPDWFGYRVRPFGTVYVVAEGRDDFEIRLHAWRLARDISKGTVLPFIFLPTAIDMRSSDADTNKLAQEVAAIDEEMRSVCGVGANLIVVDTVARALAGGNENASEVMGGFVINCGKLMEATGAAVLGVHHGGKEGGRGPRGHEALHGAADFEIEVTGATPETPNLWSVRKLKAGPGGATHRFRLRSTTVGQDDEGDDITSCVVVASTETEAKARAAPKGAKLSDAEREFAEVLAEQIDRHGVMPPATLPVSAHVQLVVSVEEVRAAYVARLSATESGDEDQISARLRQRWGRATKQLLKRKLIGSARPWLWFTGHPIAYFRLRGVTEQPDAPSHIEAAETKEPPKDDAPFPWPQDAPGGVPADAPPEE